jgi:hypothetical protein
VDANVPDIAIAFAARFLIRLVSLLPEEVDLRQAGSDVTLLCNLLAYCEFRRIL